MSKSKVSHFFLYKPNKNIARWKNSSGTRKKNGHHITAVWRDWGFRLNGKLVLYLEKFVFNRKISHLYSPTSPSARTLADILGQTRMTHQTIRK